LNNRISGVRLADQATLLMNRSDDEQTTSPEPHAAFKAKVALAAIKGDKTLADLVQQFDVHPNQITQWKAQLQEGAAGIFGSEARSDAQTPSVDLKSLHAKIGELALENDPRSSQGRAFCPTRSARPAC
jgi:transposase